MELLMIILAFFAFDIASSIKEKSLSEQELKAKREKELKAKKIKKDLWWGVKYLLRRLFSPF